MATHNDFGKEAEEITVKFLKENNYQILDINWRFLKAEIDIIAIDLTENELTIIEVKARNSDKINSPENAVNKSKKKLIIQAADAYATQKKIELEIRFDIITLIHSGQNWKINHLKNAFFAFE